MQPAPVALDMLANIAKNLCAKNPVRTVADVLDPTDVLVYTDILEGIARSTTELDHALEERQRMATCALANWKEWYAPNNCAAQPLAKLGVIHVKVVLTNCLVNLASSKMFIRANAWISMNAKLSPDFV